MNTQTPSASPVRDAAAHVVHRVLHLGRCLFSPGMGWREPELGRLTERVRRAAAAPDGSWHDRWRAALRRQPDAVVQLAAEVLYVHVLFPTDLRPATKRALVTGTLASGKDLPAVPAALDRALESGIAGTGIAFTRRRLSQIGFLLAAVRDWRGADPGTRRGALADPWAFRDWLWQVPVDGGDAQREVLLHLVHPDAFEPIVSRAVKREIVEGFAVDAPDGDVDRALLALRGSLAPRFGAAFAFIDAEVAPLWRR